MAICKVYILLILEASLCVVLETLSHPLALLLLFNRDMRVFSSKKLRREESLPSHGVNWKGKRPLPCN